MPNGHKSKHTIAMKERNITAHHYLVRVIPDCGLSWSYFYGNPGPQIHFVCEVRTHKHIKKKKKVLLHPHPPLIATILLNIDVYIDIRSYTTYFTI